MGRAPRIARTALLTLCLGTTSVAAEDGFSGGSFDDGSFGGGGNAAPSGPTNTDGGWGGGGGSFDATPTQPDAQPGGDGFGGGSFDGPQTQPDAPPGGDGFGGGSFDNGGFDNSGPGPTPPDQQGSVPGGDDFNPNGFDNTLDQPVVNGQPQPPDNPVPNVPAPPAVQIDPQILAFEARDFGVPPTDRLRSGPMHAPTPTAVPGAATVNTEAVATALNSGLQVLLIDVLGGSYSLPGAYMAPALATPGDFRDRTQQQASQWLGQITGGQKDVPILLFCSDPNCWLSYNATLRVVAAGFSNVYWYRGGLQAWQMAGLQVMPSGF